MKKLLFFLPVIFISGFCSAQSIDGKFGYGYTECFKQEAGVAPKTIPMVNDWQTKDELYRDEKGVPILNVNYGGQSFSNGCKQGKIDGLSYLNSLNNAKKKSK